MLLDNLAQSAQGFRKGANRVRKQMVSGQVGAMTRWGGILTPMCFVTVVVSVQPQMDSQQRLRGLTLFS